MCKGQCKNCKCKQVTLVFNGVTVTTDRRPYERKEAAAGRLLTRIDRQTHIIGGAANGC